MVKENELGALGKLARTNKIWDNEGADTRGKCGIPGSCTQTDILVFFFVVEKQAIWDFYPADPEKYVSLGSYFESAHGNKPPPPSFRAEYLKNIRAVRRDLLVEATLDEDTVSLL